MDGCYIIEGVTCTYTSVQLFLRFLTMPEMHMLKDMTIWMHTLLEDITQYHDKTTFLDFFLDFFLFLGLLGITLHRREGKIAPEFWMWS